LYVNNILPQVIEQCVDVETDNVCEIEGNDVTLVVDAKMIQDAPLQGAKSYILTEGTYSFDFIKFTKLSKSRFNYKIILGTHKLFQTFNDSDSMEIKWSNHNNLIYFRGRVLEGYWTIGNKSFLSNNIDKSQERYITDFSNEYPEEVRTSYFYTKEKNSSLFYNLFMERDDESTAYIFSSQTFISPKGKIRFSQRYSEEEINPAEGLIKEFDSNGTQISETSTNFPLFKTNGSEELYCHLLDKKSSYFFKTGDIFMVRDVNHSKNIDKSPLTCISTTTFEEVALTDENRPTFEKVNF